MSGRVLCKLVLILPLVYVGYMVTSCPCAKLGRCKLRSILAFLAFFVAVLAGQWAVTSHTSGSAH